MLESDHGNTYDLVCIGSSPICLLEALYRANSGGRVLLLDAADCVGGAWRECQVFGFARAEIAPHVLLFNRATYDFFASDLGVNMQRMTPSPRYVVQTPLGVVWLPYVLSPFIAYVTVPLHYVRNPRFRTNFALIKEEYFGRLGDAVKQLLMWGFARRKPYVEYPSGGTLELLDRITEKLDKSAVELRTGNRVSSLEKLDDGSIRVDWGSGTTTTRQVCITRHQSIDQFKARGSVLNVNYLPFSYQSVHLLVRMAGPLRAAFILAKRDPVVNLISDLTAYMPDVPAGFRVLVLRLHVWDGPQDADGGRVIFAHLESHGYLRAGAEFVDASFSSFEQGRMVPEDIATIEENFGDSVKVIRSTNFSNSIGAEVERWRSLAKESASSTCEFAVERRKADAGLPVCPVSPVADNRN